MKATMEATDVITNGDGVPCRVWKGTTARGIPFVAFINRLAVEPHDASEFEAFIARAAPRELTVDVVFEAFSARML